MIIEDQRGISGRTRADSSLIFLLAILFLTVPARAADTKTLPGHVPAVVAHLSAIGNLPATNSLDLAIGLPLRKQTELTALLSRLYDPASPDYRHYLTPEQFRERFGPTAADYQVVTAFARSNHLRISGTHGDRLLLDVNGSVADIQRAFHVTLKVYHHPTEARDFFAPDTEPTVDASLPIADISGLSTYGRPHPLFTTEIPHAGVTPNSGSGSGGTYMGKDFRAAYLPGVTLTGAGQTVGLLEFDGYYASDISTYESAAGLPSVTLQNVLLDSFKGSPVSVDGDTEVSLDIEMAVSMAPGLSKIVVFEGNPSSRHFFPNDVLSSMTSNPQISQFSSSWGWVGGPTATTDSYFQTMMAQGQSFFNAAGDSDAFTVGATSANGVDNTSLDNTPSSSPYITQVGATTLTTTGPVGAWSSETIWNAGDGTGSSGGISSYYAIPSWQASVSMSANGGSSTNRNIPDVAMVGDNIHVAYDNGKNTTVGGTSCAAPLWAGVAALMNQQALAAGRSTIGFINPAIYALGAGANYGAAFHDIITGNNTSPNSPANYYAVTGYDLCSGWGTPAGPSLINALAGAADPLEIFPGHRILGHGIRRRPLHTQHGGADV